MEAIDILKRARALISDPARWTQGDFARTVTGAPCDIDSPRAMRWCANGALWRAESGGGGGGDEAAEMAWLLADTAAHAIRHEPLEQVNDRHGHAAVLAVYDRAIARAAA